MFPVPEDFLRDLATRHGVTRAELDTLLPALDEHPGAEIAQQLKISEAAVRKRLGEIYRKFQIVGNNNKKLGKLKEMLLAEYHSYQPELSKPHQDWGEAVDVKDFCGREKQLSQLEQWVVRERCRLVAVLGMGGIGKTALAARLAKQVQDKFDYLIWRSLRNAPSVQDVLADLLKFLPNDRKANLPDNENTKILRLIDALRKHRCLIILDNVESVLRSGEGKLYELAGGYRDQYDLYGYLFKKVGEASHESCLLLTSREKPKEVAALEGKKLSVKVLSLPGLNREEAQAILRTKGFSGSETEWSELVKRYSGNPLVLKIAETTIHDLFGGNVTDFLNQIRQETAIYGDIRVLLDQQFHRLSDLEKQVMYWLAIDREYVALTEMQKYILSPEPLTRLLEAVESLRRRSLIKEGKELALGRLRQHYIIMEYTTERVVEGFCEEFIKWQNINFFNNYLMIKARAIDYIRKKQERFILEPVKNKLLKVFGNELESQIWHNVASLQVKSPQQKGYAAGNLINLLRQLQAGQAQVDLSGRDFSDLTIWQAYLEDTKLQDTSFKNSDIAGSVFTETMASLVAITFSPSGKLFATGVSDGEVRLWQVANNKQIHICRGHTAWVWSVAFSPDSQTLASGSADFTVKIWDVDTGECLKTFEGHSNKVYSIAFSPDGQTLVSGSEDQTVKLWDINTGKCQTLEGHTNWVWSVAFSPDGQTLTSSSADCTIKLWDANTGKCLKTLKGHKTQVYSVCFSPDGQTLASGSEDQTVKVWDVHTGKSLKTLQGHSKKVYTVAFSPDGQILASGSEDQTVKLWNILSGQCLKTLEGHISQVWSVAFSPNGRTLISSSDDQTARLWNIDTGKLLNILQGYTRSVYSVAFSPDGRILASGCDDHVVGLWDIRTGESLNTLREHKSRIRSVAYAPCPDYTKTPQTQTLATGSADCTVRLWDVADLNKIKCLQILQGHTNWVWTVVFSPDGQTLASSSEDRTIRLWDTFTGECLKILEGHGHWVWTVTFSPDGQTLASGGADNTVKLWDISTGKCLRTLAGQEGHKNLVWSVAFSPDGQTLASGSEDQTVKLWNISTGKCLKTLEGHSKQVYSVAFSPDGQILASGSGDETVNLWNVEVGKCQETLKDGHTAAVRSVAFSPDGRTLASSGDDETIQLWDLQKCSQLTQLKSDRLYERMDITGVTGLTDAQKASLKALGAIELEQFSVEY